MLGDAFSSPTDHSRIPQESAVGVSGLQVPLILFICSRFESPCAVFTVEKKVQQHTLETLQELLLC